MDYKLAKEKSETDERLDFMREKEKLTSERNGMKL